MTKICCTKCGSKDLEVLTETTSQTTGGGYSAGKGCLGYLLLGPLGLLCGGCGNSKNTVTHNTTYWVCKNCGNKFKHIDDMKKEADTMGTVGVVFIVIGILMAILFYALFSGLSTEVAMLTALISIVIFGLCAIGCFIYKSSLYKKIDEIEAIMERFNRENV